MLDKFERDAMYYRVKHASLNKDLDETVLRRDGVALLLSTLDALHVLAESCRTLAQIKRREAGYKPGDEVG